MCLLPGLWDTVGGRMGLTNALHLCRKSFCVGYTASWKKKKKKKGGFASLSPVLITSSPSKSALVSDTAGAATAGNTLAERKALQERCLPTSWCCTSTTRRISCCWRAWWPAAWLGTARRAGRMVTNISGCLFLALKVPLFFRGLEGWLWIKNQRSTWCS